MLLAKNSAVANKQLAVRELVVEYSDIELYSITDKTYIQLGEVPSRIVSVVLQDNSATTLTPVLAASVSISGTQVAAIMPAMSANDIIIVKYII